MKKCAIASIALLLAACGDETTINQTGMEVADSVENLSECTAKNEGDQAIVKGERSIRVCMDGEWIETAESVTDTLIIAGDTIYMQGGKDTVYVNSSDFSCKTEELADKSGLKIICNGDSIGVVLNGAKGDKGEDGQNGTKGEDGAKGDSGAGCSIKAKTDTTVTVACGDSAMVIQLGHAADGDTMTINLDTLIGYTQKGPFLKGSSVYLYELNGSLNQTNGNFTSVIADDDGRYRFRTRGLKYPYAMIVVDGYYRNEVTGVTSDAPIRLRAITDVSSRVTGSANVNLLTHLEFDRVNSLATGPGKLKLKEAKHKAQAEILDAFHVDTNLVKNVQSEDMNVFGKSDADAALLAISVLMQGDGKAADLSVRLTELADDLVDGKWDGGNSAALKAQLADWAAVADGDGRLGDFRSKVGNWQLSDTVPVFEKFVRNFYSRVNELGKCGAEGIPVGTVMNVKNPKSKYFAEKYADTTSRVRFICVNADSARWRVATEIEKDTSGLGHDFAEGNVAHGQVNKGLVYVYQDGKWRHGTALDSTVGKGCRRDLKDTIVHAADSGWYKCIGDSAMTFTRNGLNESAWDGAWRMASTLEVDTYGLVGEHQQGEVQHGRINEDIVYVYEYENWVVGTDMDDSVGTGCVKSLDGKIFQGLDDNMYICNVDLSNGVVRAWSKAPDIVKDTAGWAALGPWEEGKVRRGNVNTDQAYVFEFGTWRVGSLLERELERGCVRDGDTSSAPYNKEYYVCKFETVAGSSNHVWRIAPDIYNDTYDIRSKCTNNGTYSDGRIVSGLVNSSNKYICDAGEYRVATSMEKELGRGCVNKTRNYIYKTGGKFYKCQAAGWTHVTDRAEGIMKVPGDREYNTVVIGTQQWMSENLNYVTDSSSCYDNDASNCAAYGRLYSFQDAENACPSGWRLPTKNDWTTLINYAGCSDLEECYEAGSRLKSTRGWTYESGMENLSTYNGTDAFGFAALPAGRSYHLMKPGSKFTPAIDRRDYSDLKGETSFWVSGSYNGSGANYVFINCDNEVEIKYQTNSYTNSGTNETYIDYWYSVRCIQDN